MPPPATNTVRLVRGRLALPLETGCACGTDPTTREWGDNSPCPYPALPAEAAELIELRWAAEAEAKIADRVDALMKRAWDVGWNASAIARTVGVTETAVRLRRKRGWRRKGYVGRPRP